MRRKERILQACDVLSHAEKKHQSIEPLTKTFQGLTTEEAYQIQLKLIKNKVKQGANIRGKKIGLTSEAMQQSLGVNQPDYGHLLEDMEILNGGIVDMNSLFSPRIESEIAFVLKEDLKGPNITPEDVFKATNYIVPALEIIDSRIENWEIELADTIADNASSSLFVLGNKKIPIEEVNLPNVEMNLYKNGEIMNTGKGSAVLGNPVNSVVWLANKLAEFSVSLEKDEAILSGAFSAAVPVQRGDQVIGEFIGIEDIIITFN